MPMELLNRLQLQANELAELVEGAPFTGQASAAPMQFGVEECVFIADEAHGALRPRELVN